MKRQKNDKSSDDKALVAKVASNKLLKDLTLSRSHRTLVDSRIVSHMMEDMTTVTGQATPSNIGVYTACKDTRKAMTYSDFNITIFRRETAVMIERFCHLQDAAQSFIFL